MLICFYISAQCDFSAVMLKVPFPEAAIPAFQFVYDRHSENKHLLQMKILSPFTHPPHVVLVSFFQTCMFFFLPWNMEVYSKSSEAIL